MELDKRLFGSSFCCLTTQDNKNGTPSAAVVFEVETLPGSKQTQSQGTRRNRIDYIQTCRLSKSSVVHAFSNQEDCPNKIEQSLICSHWTCLAEESNYCLAS